MLIEAAALATAVGALGILAGLGLAALLRLAVPGPPVHTPLLFVALAVAVSVATGFPLGPPSRPPGRGARSIEVLRAE